MEYSIGQMVSFKMSQRQNAYSPWFIPLCKEHREGVVISLPTSGRETATYRIRLIGRPIRTEIGRLINEINVTKRNLITTSLYQELI